MTITVFLDRCMYSPFEFPSYRKKFESKGIKLVRHAKAAKVIISSYLPVLKKYTKLRDKRLIIWTHEPYHNWNLDKRIKLDGITVEIMNVYTRNVFTNNYRYCYFKTPLEQLEINENDDADLLVELKGSGSDDGTDSRAGIGVMSTYYNRGHYNGNSKTLLPLRYEVILGGYSKGYVDIYGKNWDKCPNVKALGNSRNDTDRRVSKEEVLSKYLFNICIESAIGDYYITEKLWEAIKFGCLPIYYANDTIYQTFPEDSFIDYRKFKEKYGNHAVEELFNYLESMSVLEYKKRMNLCIETYNGVIALAQNTTWRGKSKNSNINYLEYYSCYRELVRKLTK